MDSVGLTEAMAHMSPDLNILVMKGVRFDARAAAGASWTFDHSDESPGGDMAIYIRIAKTARELADVYRVRALARAELEPGLGQASPSELVDSFDTFSSTCNFLIQEDSAPIGCLRLMEVADGRFSFQSAPAFAQIEPHLKGNSLALDYVELRRNWRPRNGILLATLKNVLQFMRVRKAEHLLAMVGIEYIGLFSQVGFSTIGPPIVNEETRRHMVPMYGAMSDFSAPFAEWARSPWFDALGDNLQRCIYQSGEAIFLESEPAEAAYLVMRGSVCVTTRNQAGQEVLLDILGPGEVFGELSLLDESPRSATVRAWSQECDVLVMDRAMFRNTVLSSPIRCEEIMKFLAQRLRGSSARISALQPRDMSPLMVSVLMDVAKKQRVPDGGLLHGVTLEWLSGQVGRPPGLVQSLVGVLEQQGVVRWHARGLVLVSTSRLQGCLEVLCAVESRLVVASPLGANNNSRLTVRNGTSATGEM